METASPQDAHGVPSTLQAPRALQAAVGAHYVLEREVGRGGMATVYRARDVRHGRPVAVKVLHPELAALLGAQRFLGEIHTTAGLQHPHILPLFDSGEAAGQLYYVMPFVEGETLRARLAREQQLPLADAVRIATEVASALDYAHRHDVIHRDVKPENILLGEDGQALVADFGIALAVRHAAGERLDRLTQSGLSLGTPQYMAPEQAAGERDVDARTDVYALGAVTHEMLAGEPPFTAPTAQGVIARLMTEEPPPLTRQRRSVPPHVETAVLRALEKLPADRFPSAGAFASALQTSTLVDPTAAHRPTPPRAADRRRGRRLALSVAGVVALVLLALGVALGRTVLAPTILGQVRGPVRFFVEPDSGVLGSDDWWDSVVSGPAISPDGHTVVFAATDAGGSRLYTRRVGELTSHPLPGTEDADGPFFSPDGAWLAFVSHGAIRKVRLDGGAPVLVTGVPAGSVVLGGSWGNDDTILYSLPPGTLYRVPAAGGTPARVRVVDSVDVRQPQRLPGGRAVLVTAQPDHFTIRLGVLDLASGRLRQLGPGSAPRYVAGDLVYVQDTVLYRRPFDLARLTPTGAAEQIASGLVGATGVHAPFDVSADGSLVYRIGSPADPRNLKLTVTDRAGREQRSFPIPGAWTPRFAPDGHRVVHGSLAPGSASNDDLWITDVVAGTTQRLTFDGRDKNDAQWGPDGQSIAYSVDAPGGNDLVVQSLDGGAVRRFQRPGMQWTSDWVRQGNALLVTNLDFTAAGAVELDIWVQPLDGSPARPYLQEPGRQAGARASPDGRWAAYTSDETGRNEIYVQSYPVPGHKVLVSAGGGANPVWAPDGRELYYWHGDQLIAARIDVGASGNPLVVRDRTPLFRAPYVRNPHANYDVSPDGTRFVIVTGPQRASRLVVALNVLGGGRLDTPARR